MSGAGSEEIAIAMEGGGDGEKLERGDTTGPKEEIRLTADSYSNVAEAKETRLSGIPLSMSKFQPRAVRSFGSRL